MVRYRREGEARAAALGNRGPIRFDADGRLDPAILDAYEEHGFYVFKGVLGPDELDDIERDVIDMLDRAPVTKGADVDRHGRPALGSDGRRQNILWVRPLSDPWGGTSAANGRHPSKMNEPAPPAEAPEHVVQLIGGLAAVLAGVPARLRPPRSARRRRGDQRRRLRAVQRGGLGQAGRARRVGRLAPGRLDALGQPGPRLRAATGSTSWPSSTAARRPTGCGSCPARTAWARSTSRRWSRPPAPTACPTPCRSCARPATWRSPTARRARLVRQHEPAAAGDDQLRVPPPAFRARRRERRRPQRGRRLRRGAHPRALEGDRLRHRRPRPALPRRGRFTYRPFAGHEDEYRWDADTLERASRLQPASTSASDASVDPSTLTDQR